MAPSWRNLIRFFAIVSLLAALCLSASADRVCDRLLAPGGLTLLHAQTRQAESDFYRAQFKIRCPMLSRRRKNSWRVLATMPGWPSG